LARSILNATRGNHEAASDFEVELCDSDACIPARGFCAAGSVGLIYVATEQRFGGAGAGADATVLRIEPAN
jgi:hypothetical protein